MKKRFYIVFVSRDQDGSLNRVPVPMHFLYIFVAAAVIGMFTVAGMAGSYSRMLLKTARFNQMRDEQKALRKDYAQLQKSSHERDVQVASLGSLAGEVSALYGLTVNKLTVLPTGRRKAKDTAATALLVDPNNSSGTVDYASYVSNLDALRTNALSGTTARAISAELAVPSPILHSLDPFGTNDTLATGDPDLWPVIGPITSNFGQREDPILGNGEGEFHKGVDISAPKGTPIRATADGTVQLSSFGNGYGREVVINHGNGISTLYGHMSAFACIVGQHVSRGEVIGYVGSSGRTTGDHVHYEVRVRNTPVNPHKYLHNTLTGGSQLAGLGSHHQGE